MNQTRVKLKFPTQLSKFINHADTVHFEGGRVIDLIDSLESIYGNVKERLMEEENTRIRPYFNLFIGRNNINTLEGLYSVIPEGETLSILLARAGG